MYIWCNPLFLDLWDWFPSHVALAKLLHSRMLRIYGYFLLKAQWWQLWCFSSPRASRLGVNFFGRGAYHVSRLSIYWRTASRQKMQHPVASWPSLIRSVRKVQPPFHCLLSLKSMSENHFCCQQARCCIDSAIAILGKPPWWVVVSSWTSSLGQHHASQTKADFGPENRCPNDCSIVLLIYRCHSVASYVFFFSFVTIPLEIWLQA